MPRTVAANQRIREEQRAKILSAALAVFAHKGIDATIAEVAIAADVSYGLIYRYFASKDVLLVELIEKVLSDSLKTLKSALAMSATPGERLCALLTQIINGVHEHPEFILLVQQLLNKQPILDLSQAAGQKSAWLSQLSIQQSLNETMQTHLHALAQEQSRTYRFVLKELIVAGQATGEIINDDPDQLVTAITSCVAGLSQNATWQTPEQFHNTFPDVAIVLRMLIPQEKENTNA